MHTRQGVAVPAQAKHNVNEQFEKLRESLAPNWAPLEKLCPPGICEQFMFMGTANGIYLYKHVDSRRYLNVDASGATYAYNPATTGYDRISVALAMRLLADQSVLENLFTPTECAALVHMIVAQVRP